MTTIKLHKTAGFTMIELSIVMVILGLVVGGVLGGQALVKEAEMRMTISTMQTFQKAFISFETKYNALPGDMSDASTKLDPAAPNGNGNGNYNDADIRTNPENYGAWYHLAVGNLIKGTYTGLYGSGMSADVNMPKISIGAGTTALINYNDFYSTYYSSNNIMLVSVNATWTANVPNTSPKHETIYVADAFAMDQKMDDGKPFTGTVIGFSATAGECTSVDLSSAPNAATRKTATYDTANGGERCAMSFSVGDTTW